MWDNPLRRVAGYCPLNQSELVTIKDQSVTMARKQDGASALEWCLRAGRTNGWTVHSFMPGLSVAPALYVEPLLAQLRMTIDNRTA